MPQARKNFTKPTSGKDSREKNEGVTRAGEASLTDHNVTKSPKALSKTESKVDRGISKDIVDEEAHRKSPQKEILDGTKLEVGQIPSESETLKATTPTPSQKKISSDSHCDKRPTGDEKDIVRATSVKHIDEPLTKAIRSTAAQVSSHKQAPTTAPIGYPGLINRMFSCYQNTVYQILANIEPFADLIKGTPWTDNESAAAAGLNIIVKRGTQRSTMSARSKARQAIGPGTYANPAFPNLILLTIFSSVALRLLQLFRSMHSQLDIGDVIDPGLAAEAMSNLSGKLDHSGKVQHDAGEFIGSLINRVGLEEQDLLLREPEATEVHKLFGGMQERRVSISITSLRRSQVTYPFQIICSSCGHVSMLTHGLYGLTLEVPEDEEPTTLEAMLKDYSSTVGLPKDHKCEKCHQAGKTSQALQMTKIPRYLIVMLNRTKYCLDKKGGIQYGKKKTIVQIPQEVIDLSGYCSSKVPSDKKSYAVRGVAVHKGRS